MKFLSYSGDWRFRAGFRSLGTSQYMGVTDIQFIHANALDFGDKARKRGLFKMVDNMIKYKDFAPRITEREPFGGASKYESFSEVVSTANQWIENTTIQVINVETVVLPDRIEGTSDDVYGVTTSNAFHPVMISQGLAINCFQCVRVWYTE